jgi:hypothetical protein
MKRYCIKCARGDAYFEVLEENEEGLWVRITRIKEGDEKIIEDFMSRGLFDICRKTGYITPVENAAVSAA